MAKTTVVVQEAVGEIRRKPDHAAEQVSQAILGTPLQVLRHGDRWLQVELPDGYRGWIRSWSVHPMTGREIRSYQSGPLVEVDALMVRVREKPTSRSRGVREGPLGARLRRLGRSGNWIRVLLPDGERGYLHARELLVDSRTYRARHRPRDIPSLVRTALRFLGAPYQWGGVTAKGVDCSGLVQTVFRAHGVALPRDSVDQFRWARRETFVSRDPQDLPRGHLIFFGPTDARIGHVAISLGNGEFVHSRGRVRIDSLRPEETNFERELFRMFRGGSPIPLQ